MTPRIVSTLAACSLVALPLAATEALVSISGLELEQLAGVSFELDGDQPVTIKARTFNDSGRFGELSDVWILDARRREPVWTLRSATTERRDRLFSDHTATTRLKGGRYEAYFSTYRTYRKVRRETSVAGWLAGLVDWIADWEDFERRSGDLRLDIHGRGRRLGPVEEADLQASLDGRTIVSLRSLGDNAYANRGIALSEPARVQIYAVGELAPDRAFDSGWIVDAATGNRVWSLDFAHSRWAGGARKNRSARTELTLPAGEYVAYWGSDDSHSSPVWNSAPPYDPLAWGLTITVADPKARRSVRSFEPSSRQPKSLIVDLTRIGNGALRSAGFRLQRPMEVQILAVGEGHGSEMSDYGWIVDARTQQKVWKMEAEHTEPAGGSPKNRRADVRLKLPAGDYIANFVTDGSHAYGAWNAPPPLERERWGITVLGGEGYDPEAIEPLSAESWRGRVLATIEKVGNLANDIERFELDAPAQVQVIAVGEGSYGEMFDYGWIEDSSGRTVWRMTFADTERAGGSAKNRLFRGTVDLPAGSYRLRYKSDGSHAYGRWNATPPHEPEAWGITVSVP